MLLDTYVDCFKLSGRHSRFPGSAFATWLSFIIEQRKVIDTDWTAHLSSTVPARSQTRISKFKIYSLVNQISSVMHTRITIIISDSHYHSSCHLVILVTIPKAKINLILFVSTQCYKLYTPDADQCGTAKANDAALVAALQEYHRQLLSSNEKISQRLLTDHGMRMS